MLRDSLPLSLTRQVSPKALRSYAESTGWLPVEGVNGSIAVFHRPDSQFHQVIIPLDESFDDYGESVAEAIRKLAAYAHTSAEDVLNWLLLPPADVIRVRNVSPESEAGALRIDHAVNLLNGARRMLLATAHSVLNPQPFHRRLGLAEAEQFIRECRVGQTERGSYVVTIACPLPGEGRRLFPDDPLARQVTQSLMTTPSTPAAFPASPIQINSRA